MMDPVTGWLKIVKVLSFDLNEIARINNEYVAKFSARVSHIFNKTLLYR